MQIIDGYCGTPNIYADDIGQYNISIFGKGDCVLPVGEKLGYELVSNNEIKIKDGVFVTQGRRGVIKKGTSERCVIENGRQGEKRNDLIIIEYSKTESTMIESHMLKVIKGMSGATAVDPELITGDISTGSLIHQMPLYRIQLDGLNVISVQQLFGMGGVTPETVKTLEEINALTMAGFLPDALAIKELSQKTDEAYQSFSDARQALESALVGHGVTGITGANFEMLTVAVKKLKVISPLYPTQIYPDSNGLVGGWTGTPSIESSAKKSLTVSSRLTVRLDNIDSLNIDTYTNHHDEIGETRNPNIQVALRDATTGESTKVFNKNGAYGTKSYGINVSPYKGNYFIDITVSFLYAANSSASVARVDRMTML